MLVFTNPGLIDLEAVRTLGVSVKQPGSFGRFGTGLKFAIATILRGGGKVSLWRGLDQHQLGTVEREVRGQQFHIVTLDEQPMGITTQLGRDWQPWMVLRELGCNALDEGGIFSLLDDRKDEEGNSIIYIPTEGPNAPSEDRTILAVAWPDLETAYQQRDELFLPTSKPTLHQVPTLRILPGPSAHLFYRGIRVYKLEHPSAFTYDLLSEQYLTEDRTLVSSHQADKTIRDAILTLTDREIVRQALTTEKSYHEASLDFQDCSRGIKPSRAWLDAAIEARESKTLGNDSARQLLMKYMRGTAEEESYYGGSYRRVIDDAFQYAIDLLSDLGITFADEQKFVLVPELPTASMLTMLENGRIYFVKELTAQPAREIAMEMLLRWSELNVKGYDQDAMVKLLAPFILGRSKTLKHDEELIAEDKALLELGEPALMGGEECE